VSDISEDLNFLILKGLDVPVSWTLVDVGLQCFEILGIAHPVIWCYISDACAPEIQVI